MRYSRGMNGVMLMSAMILASAYNRQCNPPRVRDTRRDCPNFRKAKISDSRQLREFSIRGHKIMAYSKKDAITRLKHQKLI